MHSKAQHLQSTPERVEFRRGDSSFATTTTEDKKALGDLNEVLDPWQAQWLQTYCLLSTAKPSWDSIVIGKKRE